MRWGFVVLAVTLVLLSPALVPASAGAGTAAVEHLPDLKTLPPGLRPDLSWDLSVPAEEPEGASPSFKTGAGLIAVEGATPIVPMRLKIQRPSMLDEGGRAEWRNTPGWRGSVEVVFGEPLYCPAGTDPPERRGRSKRRPRRSNVTRSRVVIAAGVALVVLLAVLLVLARREPSPVAAPSPTTSPLPAAVSSPSPGAAVLDSRFGILVADSGPPANFRIRSEVDASTISEFLGFTAPAVSADGRRIAYWKTAGPWALAVREVSGGERTIVTLPADLRGGAIVWSNDGNGLLYERHSAEFLPSRGPPGGPPAPPGGGPRSSRLVAHDLTAGTAASDLEVTDGSLIRPIAWDRPGQVAAAVIWGEGGFTRDYVTWDMRAQPAGATGVRRGGLTGYYVAMYVRVSSDAKLVVGTEQETSTVRWWPLADPAASQVVQHNAKVSIDVSIRWRPGTSQLAWVAAGSTGELTLYDVRTGTRTVAATSQEIQGWSTTDFRPDGSAAILAAQGTLDVRVLDLATGRSAPIRISDQGGIVRWLRLQ